VAIPLSKLQRYDEARRELHRALECLEPFAHAAQPWKAWAVLHDLERAAGEPQAATQARQQAVQTYLAYRRAGGVGQTPAAQLCNLAAQAIQQGDTTELEQFLSQLLGAPGTPPQLNTTIPRLQAILQGSRDPDLATDPNLYYRDATELLLLLEALGS